MDPFITTTPLAEAPRCELVDAPALSGPDQLRARIAQRVAEHAHRADRPALMVLDEDPTRDPSTLQVAAAGAGWREVLDSAEAFDKLAPGGLLEAVCLVVDGAGRALWTKDQQGWRIGLSVPLADSHDILAAAHHALARQRLGGDVSSPTAGLLAWGQWAEQPARQTIIYLVAKASGTPPPTSERAWHATGDSPAENCSARAKLLAGAVMHLTGGAA